MSLGNVNIRSKTGCPWGGESGLLYVTQAYYNINRRKFNCIIKQIKKHRHIHVSNNHGCGGVKTKLFGANLKGTFDKRKGHLYITYKLYDDRLATNYYTDDEED